MSRPSPVLPISPTGPFSPFSHSHRLPARIHRPSQLTSPSGAPRGHDSLVSTLITASYWSRQCALFFPASEGGSYGLQRGLTPDAFNAYTGGWAPRKSQRLIYANGEFDPWRTAGVSSEFRPGGALRSTKEVPVQVIPGGFHCSDLILKNYDANGGVRRVVDEEVRIIRGWVGEFYEGKEGRGVGFES